MKGKIIKNLSRRVNILIPLILLFLFCVWLLQILGMPVLKESFSKIINNINIFFIWDGWIALSSIALFITAIFIYKQASATEVQASATRELTNKTMLPRVQVGIKLRNKNGRDVTMVSIHNLSSFPIWIWLDIDLSKDKDFSEDKKLINTLSYSGFPIPPNRAYEFHRQEIDSLISQYGKVYANIQYRCSINSSFSDANVKPTKLFYRYKPSEKRWLINDMGMEFVPLYDNLVRG